MQIIEDDLFSDKYIINAIFHQCNCFCTMGAGFARQLAEKYPQVLRADMTTEIGDVSKLGTFTKAFISPETAHRPKMVYNLYSQYRYGRNGVQTDYNALKTAFETACDDLQKIYEFRDKIFRVPDTRPIVIGIPYLIGCGLAGGDEKTVTDILDGIMESRKDKMVLKAFRRK